MRFSVAQATIPSVDKLRLFIVLGSSIRGGAELQTIQLAQRVADRQEFEVHLLFLEETPTNRELVRDERINYHFLGLTRRVGLRRLVKNFLRCVKLFASVKPNVAHANMVESILITYACSIFCREKFQIISSIFSSVERHGKMVEVLENRALKKSSLITVNSEYLRKYVLMKQRGLSEKVQVVYNGLEIPDQASDIARNTAVYVIGNFHKYKGHAQLVNWISELQLLTHWVFLGFGTEQRRIEKEISRLGLRDLISIRQTEHVYDELQCAKFLVHFSSTESLSNAILEAMAMGIPAIAFDVGGNRELIQDGLNGFLISPYDKARFKDAFTVLDSDSEKLVELGRSARETARKFAMNHMVDTYYKFYKSLARSR